MERDILRRTHNIFSSLKDESGNKYDDRDTNVMFVDENTLKYQNVIKKMEGNKSSSGSGESGSEEDELNVQTTVITTNVKHVGKGVIVQSYEISDDEDDEDDEGEGEGEGDDNNDYKVVKQENKVIMANVTMNKNPNKKIVYKEDKNINVDDI
jgi:hypothetical protein